MRALMREAMESQLEDLRQQLAEYDALRTGHIQVLELDSLAQLPEAFIRARIAAGLTQKELARRLGMREQQVQRYEATRYSGVSLTRLQQVADALGVRIHERVLLPTAAGGPRRPPRPARGRRRPTQHRLVSPPSEAAGVVTSHARTRWMPKRLSGYR
jgi:transcriptional regulator with XRE-family HTH domain